jgi:DHA1 family bicyclomycin/chloramphenicol resistance-like MFS transporter
MNRPMPSERVISRVEFIALIAALMALNALAIDVMLPALPYMGEALGVTVENDRHYVITAFMLGLGAMQLMIGPLSDRFGRRVPLLLGIGVYVLASIGATMATDFNTLLAMRFIQGVGAAGTRVIGQSVVRDRYSGRDMAEIMSLTFMVFMAVPIIAPSIGQVLLLTGPWQSIFVFMALLGVATMAWTYLRLPETLPPERRRPLRAKVIAQGFAMVARNRQSLCYGLASMFVFGALYGFITTAQQIFVDIYGLGAYFPIAFGAMAGMLAVAGFLNSRFVRRFGMRRISHVAMLIYTLLSGVWVALSLFGALPFALFFVLLVAVMFMFGTAMSNMNTLAMEPLGAVAGTASSVFGFTQTVGGALIGTLIGQQFNGTTTPTAAGYFFCGLAALGAILIAERGRLFGSGLPPATQGAA